MPTYDFECKACNHRFSAFLAIKDKDQAACPVCGSNQVAQLFTGFMFSKGGSGESAPPVGGG